MGEMKRRNLDMSLVGPIPTVGPPQMQQQSQLLVSTPLHPADEQPSRDSDYSAWHIVLPLNPKISLLLV
jgi:hypothetical protein